MAVTTQESTEYTALVTTPSTLYPDQYHGVMRVARFTHEQSGAGDAGSSVAICKLPPGRVRVMLSSSWAYVNWTTASALLDLGWDAYTALSDGSTVAASTNGLCNDIDVDAVGIRQFSTGASTAAIADGYSYLFESKTGVTIRATSPTAIVSGDDLRGHLAYVKEG